eukprot:362458-Chlamydomonas_euryale.AAC.2
MPTLARRLERRNVPRLRAGFQQRAHRALCTRARSVAQQLLPDGATKRRGVQRRDARQQQPQRVSVAERDCRPVQHRHGQARRQRCAHVEQAAHRGAHAWQRPCAHGAWALCEREQRAMRTAALTQQPHCQRVRAGRRSRGGAAAAEQLRRPLHARHYRHQQVVTQRQKAHCAAGALRCGASPRDAPSGGAAAAAASPCTVSSVGRRDTRPRRWRSHRRGERGRGAAAAAAGRGQARGRLELRRPRESRLNETRLTAELGRCERTLPSARRVTPYLLRVTEPRSRHVTCTRVQRGGEASSDAGRATAAARHSRPSVMDRRYSQARCKRRSLGRLGRGARWEMRLSLPHNRLSLSLSLSLCPGRTGTSRVLRDGTWLLGLRDVRAAPVEWRGAQELHAYMQRGMPPTPDHPPPFTLGCCSPICGQGGEEAGCQLAFTTCHLA